MGDNTGAIREINELGDEAFDGGMHYGSMKPKRGHHGYNSQTLYDFGIFPVNKREHTATPMGGMTWQPNWKDKPCVLHPEYLKDDTAKCSTCPYFAETCAKCHADCSECLKCNVLLMCPQFAHGKAKYKPWIPAIKNAYANGVEMSTLCLQLGVNYEALDAIIHDKVLPCDKRQKAVLV